MTTLLHQIQALEIELHHPGNGCSRERLEQLLHPRFHEVGRSGVAYDRETVIRNLTAQASVPAVSSEHFELAELGPEVALLTYRSADLEVGGGRARHALRSSVWVRTAAGWQLRYHQGTATAATW